MAHSALNTRYILLYDYVYFHVQIVKRAELWVKDLALDNMYYPNLYLDGKLKYMCTYFYRFRNNDCCYT